MKVEWSNDALNDFEAAIAYLAERDERVASLVTDRVEATCSALGRSLTGRPGRVEGTFEKRVQRTSYIVAYAVGSDTVTILRVVHSARDWKPGRWPD